MSHCANLTRHQVHSVACAFVRAFPRCGSSNRWLRSHQAGSHHRCMELFGSRSPATNRCGVRRPSMGEALAPTRGRHTQTPPRMKHKKTTVWRRARNFIRPQNIDFFDFDNSGEVHETLAKSRVFADLVASMKTRFLTQHTQKQIIKQRILLKSRFYFFCETHKHRQNQWFSRIGSHSQNEDFTKTFKNITTNWILQKF